MRLHTDFFEKLHEKFPTITEDAVIEGFYKFLKDITIESNIDYPSEIDISTVTGTAIKFTDSTGNVIGIIEPVKKENFNHGIQLRVDDQVLGLFISDEYIATAVAPTPVPLQEGGNPKSIVTLDSFKQLTIYTLEELGLSFTEDGFLEIDTTDDSLSSVGFVKKQLDALKQEIIDMIPTNDEIARLAALPRGSIIVWTSKDIPNGWAICDGTNGTPDMRDRFIVGASNRRDINVIGGTSSSSSNSKANISNHFHYWGYESGDNCGVFLTSGGLADVEWSDNNCCDVRAKGLLPSKELIEKSFSNNDSGHTYHNVLGATMVRWNGHDDGSDENAVPIEQGGMYKKLNTITTLGISNEAENESESVGESLPPFYSVYYIMKITDSYTELDGVKWDNEPTPGSINPVTSGGIYTYYENKLKGLSDRIDSISDSLDNIPDYTALQKSIEVIKARLDKYYDGYEKLVYAESIGEGTWTSVVGQEYPSYKLVGAVTCRLDDGQNGDPFVPTATPYAIYRCIEPSTCSAKITNVDSSGTKWDVQETPGKFEFVRWENE
mgnify:CR=1 FL=1